MKLHSHQIITTVGSALFALGVILAVSEIWYVGLPVAVVGIVMQVTGLLKANKFRVQQESKTDK
ncbi:MAG: hypothetical protein ACYTDT_02035 [Planctomycetota bacterium]|jgi:membrane-bound ClpP family serine protease